MKTIITMSLIFLLNSPAFAGTTQVGSAGGNTAPASTIDKQGLFGPLVTQVDLNIGDAVIDGDFVGNTMYDKSIICSEFKINDLHQTFRSIAPGETIQAGGDKYSSRPKANFTCNKKRVRTALLVHFGCVTEADQKTYYYTTRAAIPEDYARGIEDRGDVRKKDGVPEAIATAERACAEVGGVLNQARPVMIRGKMILNK